MTRPLVPSLWQPDAQARAQRALRRRDARLAGVIRRVGPPTLRRRGSVYRSLLRAVLFQQLAGAAARAIERRFVALYGGGYPQPADLLATRAPTLRRAGLSRQKIAARPSARAKCARAASPT